MVAAVVTPRFCVVIVFIGKANALSMMQLVHHALKDLATALELDDSDAKSPAYFFDISLARAEATTRATLFGLKGMANAHLAPLLATAHALVVVSDGGPDNPAVAAHTLSARMPEARRERVYALRIADSEQAREAVLAVLDDLAQ